MTQTTSTITSSSSAEDIVKFYNTDLTGKIVIITGANSGVGLENARVLSSVGAKVIIPCRTLEKANGAIQDIKKTVPHADLVPMQLDLSDLSSIKAFADTFLALELPLHILINNAGIMACPKSFTKDGFEAQFGVNHLGHFYLTELLMDKLKQSAPARVVVVSSCGNSQMLGAGGIDFDNLNAEKRYSYFKVYGQSKLANILHAKELQRRFDAQNVDITVVSLHPGFVESNLMRHITAPMLLDYVCSMRNYRATFQEMSNKKQVGVGASTNVYCAVSPDIKKGAFYSDNTVNTVLLNEQADNQKMAKKLWDVSNKMIASALL
ncbi:retinol dehydrogenase 12-like [Mucor ambiguus]|uniref:Retinol dehydrogenase 12-like n=1 Tax=Mucor ambiguus TaxID=91626 RepID=A0A0C9LPY1_9FUNG|nr:retinol dehydrogenase 12-like [Mucor ambiguus]